MGLWIGRLFAIDFYTLSRRRRRGDRRDSAFVVMIAYKYCEPDRIDDVLENGMIRFTQPADFNDPFEASPSFSENRSELDSVLLAQYLQDVEPCMPQVQLQRLADGALNIACLRRKHALGLPAKLSEHFVALCLSRSRNNLLMWAHYTDCHRGFVIGFDTESEFFKRGALGGLREVTYANIRARVPERDGRCATPEELDSYNNSLFFTKSCDWAYEKELRILRRPQDADCVPGKPKGWDICLFRFPLEAVREVIIGARMTEDKLARIVELCQTKYRHAQVLRASLDPEQFAMEVTAL
jgi:DUF2971 family protein